MRLKLQENPREWQKFTAVMALVAVIVALMLRWRRVISWDAVVVVVGLGAGTLLWSLLWPEWFRGFYRVGMTVSFHIGQILGRILLTVFFFLVVTPLGIVLRCLGKDLLGLKRKDPVSSYWRPARTDKDFDRLF